MIDLIVGLILLVLGAWGIIAWWDDFGEFLRGLLPLIFLLIGLAAIGAGLKKTRRDAEDTQEAGADTHGRPAED